MRPEISLIGWSTISEAFSDVETEAVTLTGRITEPFSIVPLFFNPHEEARGWCVFKETEKGDLFWLDLERLEMITHGFCTPWQILLDCAIDWIWKLFYRTVVSFVVVVTALQRTWVWWVGGGEAPIKFFTNPNSYDGVWVFFLVANNNVPRLKYFIHVGYFRQQVDFLIVLVR